MRKLAQQYAEAGAANMLKLTQQFAEAGTATSGS